MACRFTKVSEEIVAINEAASFYPSGLVNTKTTIPHRVGEERWIYTLTLHVLVDIHHYLPLLRGTVVYYYLLLIRLQNKLSIYGCLIRKQQFGVRVIHGLQLSLHKM